MTIIPDLSLEIENGEFFTLLGPSGCGKTTLLRMIAGFNTIESGNIRFDDSIINSIPAHKRNIGMVFQNYAIFPHMTVRQNVEYGLKMRKMKPAEIKERVDQILDIVKIQDYQDRFPEKLSGGQQQRVALARAIVIHPNVLLMDEPLSNLDAKLRVEMRSAIREIQKQVGITTVYVTHDQEEALAISDRIAVMRDGVIQQTGAPEHIYTRPANLFVSTFIGHSNLIYASLSDTDDLPCVRFAGGYSIPVANLCKDVEKSGRVIVSIRPEEFSLHDEGIRGTVTSRVFLGKYIIYQVRVCENLYGNTNVVEYSQDSGQVTHLLAIGDTVFLKPNITKINIFSEKDQLSMIKDVNANG